MFNKKKINLLINLPTNFHGDDGLKKDFARLTRNATVRRTSHNKPEEIHADLVWADAVVMWAWPTPDEATIQQAKNLKWRGSLGDTRKMAELFHKHGIANCEVRHCWSPAVAEMALTLMLAGLRKTSQYHMDMRQGTEQWHGVPGPRILQERQLAGRSVGIIGFGGIGQRLAKLLAPFEVDLRIHDPFLPREVARQFGAKPVSVMELVRKSEVAVLCAANVPGAAHVLDAKAIAALQANAILVNVGRSMLVDMPALIARLKKGNLTAMLDVFDKEPLEPDSPLRQLPNAYLTPHRAGGLYSSLHRAFTWLADDLEAFRAGKPLKYQLSPKAWTSLG